MPNKNKLKIKMQNGDELSAPKVPDPEVIGFADSVSEPLVKKSKFWWISSAAAVALILIIGGFAWFVVIRSNSQPVKENEVKQQIVDTRAEFPLASTFDVADDKVTINGQLQAASGIVINPSSRSANPTIGEIYLDQTTKQLFYYNGNDFVSLGNQITNVTNVINGGGTTAGVSSLQGISGAVSIQGTSNQVTVSTAGSTITLSTPQDLATISSPTFASLVLGSNLLVGGTLNLPLNCTTFLNGGSLTTNGAGQVICADDETSSSGTSVTTAGGTIGTIPVFIAADQVGDSILTQATGTITVGGNLSITGTSLVSGLATFNGGLTVQLGDTFTFNSDAFTDLTGNGLQVSSGVLTLSLQVNKGLEVDGSGLSLIDCNSGEILKYNGSNQWACATDAGGSGVGDDIQINGTGVTNTGNFVNTAASSTNGSTTWTLNAGSPDQISVAVGLANGTEAGLISANAQTFGGDKTFNGLINVGSSATNRVTLDSGLISSVRALSSDQFLKAQVTGDSNNRYEVLANGTINWGSGSAATDISLSRSGAGALTIQGSSGATLTVQGASVTVGTTSQAGSLVLHDGSSNTVTLSTGAYGQDTVITLPDPGASSDTVCLLTLANCLGVGGGVNQQLSNLSGTVAVNLALNPGADNTLDLGSSANSWRTLYADTSVLAPAIDRATAGTLSIGTSTATALTLGNTSGSSTVTLQAGSGGVVLGTGAVNSTNDTSTYLCRNSLNQLATCATTGTGTAFVQGGNNFGTTGTLGLTSADTLNIVTSNTTRISVSSGGNTTVTGGTSGAALTVSNSTSTGNILTLNDNSTTVFSVADGGNVAVGTASAPTARLDVVSNSASISTLRVSGTNPYSGGASDYIFVDGTGNAGISIKTGSGVGNNAVLRFFENATEGGSVFLQTSSDDLIVRHSRATGDLGLETNSTRALTINSTNQDVGIGVSAGIAAKLDILQSKTGTTAATDQGLKLTVNDTGAVTSGTDTTYGQNIAVTRTGGSGTGVFNTTGINLQVTGDTGGSSTTTGLNVNVQGADANYAAVFTGGGVGIGTATPAAALHISGLGGTNVASIIDNGTSTGDILRVQDNGTNVLTVSDGGAVLAKSTSTAAFQVQSAATSTEVLTVDTTNSNLAVRGINSTASIGSELASGMSCSGTGWTGTGPWTHTSGSGTNTLSCSPPASVTAGATYQVVFTISGNTLTNNFYYVSYTLGGTSSGISGFAENATYTTLITATNTAGLVFTPSNLFDGAISSISVKQVTGTNSVLAVQNSNGSSSAALEVRSGGSGLSNSFIGTNSGFANTSGSLNSAVGGYALQSNTTGGGNSAVGYSALISNTVGNYNSALGGFALASNKSGVDNTSLGYDTLRYAQEANQNTAVGSQALHFNNYGDNNTAVGYAGLYFLFGGSNNSSLGADAGRSILQGSGNTFIGSQSGYQDPNVTTFVSKDTTNSTAIGYGAQVQANNSLVLGGQGANQVNVGIGTTIPLNTLSVMPVQYSTGTICQGANSSCNSNGSQVFGTGTTFTSAMVGSQLIFADGTTSTITGFTSATNITVSTSITHTSSAYRIHYIGLQVTNAGNALVGGTLSVGVDAANRTIINNGLTSSTRALANDQFLKVQVSGDGNNRYEVLANGTINWGSGSAASDISLSRSGAGALLVQGTTNSPTAFQVKNAAGTNSLLTVDTTNLEVSVGAPPTNGSTFNVYGGLNSIGDGAGYEFNARFADSASAAQGVGGGIAFAGNADQQRIFGVIQGYHESATASNYAGALRFLTRPNGGSPIQVMNLSSTGQATFQNSTDSATAFRVLSQTSTGSVAVLTASTSNFRVGVNSPTPTAALQVSSSGGGVPLFIVTDGTATALDVLTIADEGATTFRTRTDSANAFRVQNADGDSIFGVGTTDGVVTLRDFSNAQTIYLNEGLGQTTNGADIRFTESGLIAAGDNIHINIDSDNDSTDAAFSIRKDTATNAGTELFRVQEDGRVGINTGSGSLVADLNFGVGADRTIKVLNQTASNTAGNNLTIGGADGLGTGAGGHIVIGAGTGGATGTGGNTLISGGGGGSTSGAGGTLTLQGGSANGTNSNGGDLFITPGAKTGSGTSGTVVIKPQASNDSTSFFQVQNAGGTAFLTADSTNLKITVTNLVVTANLTVEGHIISGGNTPGYSAGGQACTSPTINLTGNDIAGKVEITAGSSCPIPSGSLVQINFDVDYDAIPKGVIITPANDRASAIQYYVDDTNIAVGSFTIDTSTQIITGYTYKFNYIVIQ